MLGRSIWYCHPNNRAWLLAGLEKLNNGESFPPLVSGPSLFHEEIVFSKAVAERNIRKEWVPPQHRFIEYEESDYEWLQRLGMGTTTYHDEGPLLLRMPISLFEFRDFCSIKLPRYRIMEV